MEESSAHATGWHHISSYFIAIKPSKFNILVLIFIVINVLFVHFFTFNAFLAVIIIEVNQMNNAIKTRTKGKTPTIVHRNRAVESWKK